MRPPVHSRCDAGHVARRWPPVVGGADLDAHRDAVPRPACRAAPIEPSDSASTQDARRATGRTAACCPDRHGADHRCGGLQDLDAHSLDERSVAALAKILGSELASSPPAPPSYDAHALPAASGPRLKAGCLEPGRPVDRGDPEPRRLLLLDGHSLAYRAFFALPIENFSTTTGQPTNAVYGFTVDAYQRPARRGADPRGGGLRP